MKTDRRTFLVATGAGLAGCTRGGRRAATGHGFRCPPCGCAMDGERFGAPGVCPACGMSLEAVREAVLGDDPASLPPGSGVFSLAGGPGRRHHRISVHYYRPAAFTPTSSILIVVPGAGRNSGEYRNAWIETAERTGALIAALGYPEAAYDFGAYHLGGVASRVVQRDPQVERRERSTVVRLNDDGLDVAVDRDRSRWLFWDLDRVFGWLRSATGSTRRRYLLFGHSAGAQIIHRAALFHPELRADAVVAANAGFYTLPLLTRRFPLGLGGVGLNEAHLERAFSVNLTVLLGELDNDDDAGGTLLHTPALDADQGHGRLDRGRTFYQVGQRQAERLGSSFSWSLRTVPGVGHDHVGMGRAAAEILLP